jgi:hypothetical protein
MWGCQEAILFLHLVFVWVIVYAANKHVKEKNDLFLKNLNDNK